MKLKEKWAELGVITAIGALGVLNLFLLMIERDLESFKFKQIVSFASSLENSFYDIRSQNHWKGAPKNTDTVLVELDDESFSRIGVNPLPRKTWSDLLERLATFEAQLVAFDIIFPERSLEGVEVDEHFAKAVSDFNKTGTVIIPYTTTAFAAQDTFAELPDALFDNILNSKSLGKNELTKNYVHKFSYPIDELANSGAKLATINMHEDSDGVFRFYPLVRNIDGIYFPSMALSAFENLTKKQVNLIVNKTAGADIAIQEKNLELNTRGEVKIKWLGDHRSFSTIALWKVLSPDTDENKLKKLFKNKAVFVGSTASGAHDLRNTPIDTKLPGVYTHMNVLHMLSAANLHQSTNDSIFYSALIMLLSLGSVFASMQMKNAIIDFSALAAVLAAGYYSDQLYFLPLGFELKLVTIFSAVIGSYSLLSFLHFQSANREKKQIKGAFSRYVAPSIVKEMLDNPDKLKVGGDRKHITCLFSDIRDFTSISEQTTPTQLANSLNTYLGEMTKIIFETTGTLDKYIGDAVVAFWGAPLEVENQETQAVAAAVRMIDALPKVNVKIKEQCGHEFRVGIGLNSGTCSVGNMGSDEIFAYTALGDAMNLGARLESLCKHYQAQILISEATFNKINSKDHKTRIVDKVQVKGKKEGVWVYEVLHSYHPFTLDPYSLKNYQLAYESFLERDFDTALKLIHKVLEAHPSDFSSKNLKEKIVKGFESSETGEDFTLTVMNKK